MSEDVRETIIDSFTDVLEKMAFMFVEEADEDETEAPGAVKAEMHFSGAHTGSLIIAISHETANELASNVLGVEPDDENIEELRNDAVRELLNVTCGNLLTAHYGEEPVFDLSVPEVATIDEAAWNAFVNAPDAIALLVDDNPAAIQFNAK